MKKLLLFFLLGFAVAFSFGQRKVRGNGKMATETRNISGYSGVVLRGSLDVFLTPKTQGKIDILADENIIPVIVTKLVDGKLEVSFKENTNVSYRKPAIVYVPFEGINDVQLLGSGDIKNEGIMETQSLTLSLRGSGDINLNINANSVWAKLFGSGDMRLKGTTKNLDVELTGSGDVSAYQLNSEKVEAVLVGSGDVEVSASHYFSGDLRGSGDIRVKGKPAEVQKKTKGSGTIKIL